MDNKGKKSKNNAHTDSQNNAKELSKAQPAKSPKLKVCEVCQRLEFLSEETILTALHKYSNCIDKYAYILHDKDTDKDGNPVSPHWHIILKFNDSRTLKHIASWFSVEEQYVSKSTSKSKNKFLDMCRYLIHSNKEEKYQYAPALVHANFDYVNFINQTSRSKRKQDIIDMIMAGTITPLNFTSMISPEDYDSFKRSITNAFEYKKHKDYSIDRNMEVIYIYGLAGSGKTSYAKKIAEERNLSIFVSGSNNDSFDGYTQEECIVLDDYRGGNHLNFSEILKLLDNFTNSKVASRYSDKDIGHCKLLIITSVFPIEQFYNMICPSGIEPFLQLKRRCGTYMHVEKDTIHVYRFDKKVQDYVFVGDCVNPLDEILRSKPTVPVYTDDELLTSLGLDRKPTLPKTTSPKDTSSDDPEIICPF